MKKAVFCSLCGRRMNLLNDVTIGDGFGVGYYVEFEDEHQSYNVEVNLCIDCFDKMVHEYIIPRAQVDVIKTEEEKVNEENHL